jgi:hypothetical protein
MRMHFSLLSFCVSFVCLVSFCTMANDAKTKWSNFKPFKFEVGSVFWDSIDTKKGESFKRSSYHANMTYNQPLSRAWGVGLNLGYDHYLYNFDDFASLEALTEAIELVQRETYGINIGFRGNEWIYALGLSTSYGYAENIDRSDGFGYGVSFNVMKRFDNQSLLGVGVMYSNDAVRTRIIPYVIAKWQINQQWCLTNPFNNNFSGRAGLELIYQGVNHMEFGFGGAYRLQSFMSKEPVEINQYLSFLRLSWIPIQVLQLNSYVGYFFGGEVEVAQKQLTRLNGHPSVAMSLSVKL